MAGDGEQAQQHVDAPQDQDRLDVPGMIDTHLLLGSVKHARDEQLLKHLSVAYVLDAENPRKRSPGNELAAIDHGRVDLDDDYTFESFKDAMTKASAMIERALQADQTVFVFCTHGNNESAVVCMAYLLLSQQWTLERAYKHVLQKRPASAPRRAYVEKLRFLEREVHGHVTLRSAQVGPSMMDLMLGLRGETRDDADETASQVTEPESVESTVERASIVSNFSMTTAGLHNGSSLRETMIIAERDDEYEAPTKSNRSPPSSASRNRTKNGKKDCVVM